MNKVLLINKPKGWTSFDVVAKVRSELRIKNQEAGIKKFKVGHAGTLDPFATGLLIVLVGVATKEQDKYMKLDKEYEAVLELGKTSTTGDPEGIIKNQEAGIKNTPTSNDIATVLESFKGEIEQVPPQYSAIKIGGKRAYELARAGKKAELKPRKVKIYDLEILDYKYPFLKIKVNCSSGTYIRTLAEDIGKEVKTGAYLTELKRTKIGDFELKKALDIQTAIDKFI